jgi:acetyl esterase/lipase
VLAVIGLACGAVAAGGAATAVFGASDARLSYYALLAGGSTMRFLALATLGSLLGIPAIFGSRGSRTTGWVVLSFGAGCAALNAALSVPVFIAARALGQPMSLSESLFGKRDWPSIRPEVLTFAAGPGYQLQADLYRTRADPAVRVPSVVVVHGGAWRGGDKGENVAWNQWLAEVEGYVVLDIQYRLTPAATWEQQVIDIRDAVAWLRSHADELQLDPERVALLGRSAGGHLSLLAAYTWGDADGPPPAGVVALYPPTDLERFYDATTYDMRQAVIDGIGRPPAVAAEAYRAASPIKLVRGDLPPTLLLHGTWDELVPVEHSDRLAEALQKVGARVRLVRVPNARHAFDAVLESPASQLARGATDTFLHQTLRGDAAAR